MTAADQTPARRAGADVRRLIRHTAVDVHGATVLDVEMPGSPTLTRPMLDDTLAGVRAADLIRQVALGQLRDHADAARAAGRSWGEVADALGITDGDAPRGELAYLWLVDGQPLPVESPSLRRSSTWWRCATCGERVTDYGPFDPHPTDQEDGHAAECDRHAAALSIYDAGWKA